MTRRTTRRIKTTAKIMMACVPVALTYELLDAGVISIIGVVIGVALAVPLVVLEESGFDRRMKRLSFSVALLTTALTYVASLAAVFMSVSLVVGYLLGQTMSDYWAFITGVDFRRQVVAGFVMYLVIVFFSAIGPSAGAGCPGPIPLGTLPPTPARSPDLHVPRSQVFDLSRREAGPPRSSTAS